jgi:hypothetical protein
MKPVSRRAPRPVSRAEIDRILDVLEERGIILNDLRRGQEMQFKRLAQLQAELDAVRRAWEKLNLT